MTRPYPFRIEHWLRVGAALTLTAALAGCGATGTSSPPTSTAQSRPAPATGPANPRATATHGGGAVANPGNDGVAVPVVQETLGSSSHVSGQLTRGGGSQLRQGGLPGVVQGSSINWSSGGGAPSSSAGSGGSSRAGSSAGQGHRVRVVTRNHTVVRTVAPDIPSGAVLPSHRVVTLTRFAVGQNIVCDVVSRAVRCDINHRTWIPAMPQPNSCHRLWGQSLEVIGTAPARFLCTNTTLIFGHPPRIKPGYDDVFGDVRCEVRRFGVNCFVFQHHGFLLSRSGYVRY